MLNSLWQPAGGETKWSQASGWSDGIPTAGVNAVFNGTSACLIDSAAACDSVVGSGSSAITLSSTLTVAYVDCTCNILVSGTGKLVITAGYSGGTCNILNTSTGEVDITLTGLGNYQLYNSASNPTAGPLSKLKLAGATGTSYKLAARVNVAALDAAGITNRFNLTCGTVGLGKIFTCPAGCTVSMPSTRSWLHVDHCDNSNGTMIVAQGGTDDGNNTKWDLSAYVPIPPVLSTIANPDPAFSYIGANFHYAISATHSPTSYNATGLPPGLSVNTTTGVISGIPTTSGYYSVVLSATNTDGTGTLTILVEIEIPEALEVP